MFLGWSRGATRGEPGDRAPPRHHARAQERECSVRRKDKVVSSHLPAAGLDVHLRVSPRFGGVPIPPLAVTIGSVRALLG